MSSKSASDQSPVKMSNGVLGDKDVNAPATKQAPADLKSMEYHRQVLQSKIAEQP
jgi:hypothetical protein